MALDRVLRERPGLGAAYLFPAPGSPDRPITKDTAERWLAEAEKLAKLPHLERGGWAGPRRWCGATSRRMTRLCWPSCSVPVGSGKNRAQPARLYTEVDSRTVWRP